jgi:hypothetical protein
MASRSLYDEFIDIMLSVPALLEGHDRLSANLITATQHQVLSEVFKEGHDLVSRCIRVGETLQNWEERAIRFSADTVDFVSRSRTEHRSLLEICKLHGYGFFHSCMQYWGTSIVVYATTWAVQRSMFKAANPVSESLPPPFAWLNLQTIPDWVNPGKMAANIACSAAHYFEDAAGYWGASSATYSIGAASHYYAATGNLDSAEMRQIYDLYKNAKLATVTRQFLRSVANTPSSAKGDCARQAEHIKMAGSWYRMGTVMAERPRRPDLIVSPD